MSEATNPRATMGANVPPLDRADQLHPRLEREYADLLAEVAQVEADSFALPEAPESDEDTTKLSDHVIKAKGVLKRLEEARTDVGRPYLEGQRVINAWFGEAGELLADKDTGVVARLTTRVGIYNKAKAVRLEAERLAAAREAERRAQEARAEEQRKQDESDRLAREAGEAAERIRKAKSQEEMEAAEADMRQLDAQAGIARDAAGYAGKAAAKAERQAEQNERAASGATGNLSRVSAGGSTSSVTKFWTHTILDADALMASLGPLGPFLGNGVIMEALARAVREAAAAGRADKLVLPGCRVFQDSKTNISARR
jgi:hypothetical protein